jgi:hypothetical protein
MLCTRLKDGKDNQELAVVRCLSGVLLIYPFCPCSTFSKTHARITVVFRSPDIALPIHYEFICIAVLCSPAA